MRTSIRNSICLACGLLALSACKKDFLEKDPTELLTADQIAEAGKWNEDVALGFVNGTLQTFFKSLQSTPSSHDDFAQKAFDIESDLMSGDMELQGGQSYGWFTSVANLLSYQKFETLNYSVWRISYRTVSLANGFFRSVGSDESVPEKQNKPKTLYNWGQVKALRALAYLNLAHFYGKPYSDATKSSLVVPIYRAADDASKPGKLATLDEVYQFIVKDLIQAADSMDKSKVVRSNKQYLNATVARGALARAYMDMGQWEKAYDVANTVITTQAKNYPLIAAKDILTNGFNDYKTPEFIWAININEDNTGKLVSFWGHMDVFTYSYASVGAGSMPTYRLRSQVRTSVRDGSAKAKAYLSTSSSTQQGKSRATVLGRVTSSSCVWQRCISSLPKLLHVRGTRLVLRSTSSPCSRSVPLQTTTLLSRPRSTDSAVMTSSRRSSTTGV